ncbi:23S rRNA (adenine(2030)-N(6))-methyltransferase RlmJ [Methylovorus mays]|uniref:23S rRNA (adenine(2030)-N(6))-methyltransferase RlmJ n=1 Tax=Methylovorus mays TaxID=184077 RepID=UPI001E632924|nr:23S rRNA (adenine(2030)-N(6))-methyltransferase RlmJ [Methylovorus mays]MCB5206833.1 23S rRNA (adenine(2030)-N(6))-methyltransferase RlmJ [Methylovorus mays]
MLSYRHAFHAGNHADVLKHFVLMQVLQYTGQKGKPYWYIDTHAGAGKYALDTGYATQNAEFESGISRLWQATDLPAPLAEYVHLIRQENPDGKLRLYPGSPAVAEACLRDEDRMRLFELHPNDFKLLRQTFQHGGRKVMLFADDGFAGIKALLPPPPRRAVVLIDPPYEEKQDYQRVVTALQDALQRFATGTYIIWYPLLQRAEPQQMIDKLKRLQLPSWLHVTLTVQHPSEEGFGMHGSGLFIVNPPWTLPATLQETLPWLTESLGQDNGADYTLEHLIP